MLTTHTAPKVKVMQTVCRCVAIAARHTQFNAILSVSALRCVTNGNFVQNHFISLYY